MKRIIIAFDFSSESEALALAEQLNPHQCRIKIGKECFTACGPQLVMRLQTMGFDIFLDLKFHDIPNTVAKACLAAADLGVWMLNVHALGGEKMLTAAREALSAKQTPLLIAVTILTSHDQQAINQIGLSGTPQENVIRLARLAEQCGLDGVVCSAQEAKPLRQTLSPDFKLVTPGIRLPSDDANDQSRIMTPTDAISAGVDYLVVGRPITQARNPQEALQQYLQYC